VGVFIDTFDDQRRGYEFISNPFGVQADLINDATTGNEDPSWDGVAESRRPVGVENGVFRATCKTCSDLP